MYTNILIVMDDRTSTQSAIRHAMEMALVHDASLHFHYPLASRLSPLIAMELYAVFPFEDQEAQAIQHARMMLKSAVENAKEREIHTTTSIGRDADSLRSVLNAVEQTRSDLMVVGAEGNNALQRLLTGSLVSDLLAKSPVPVLVCNESGAPRGFGRRASVALRARLRRTELAERRRKERND